MMDAALKKNAQVQAKVSAMAWLGKLLTRATDRNERQNDDACLPSLHITVACEKREEIRRAKEAVFYHQQVRDAASDADNEMDLLYWQAYVEALRLPVITIKDAEMAMTYPYPLDGLPVTEGQADA